MRQEPKTRLALGMVIAGGLPQRWFQTLALLYQLLYHIEGSDCKGLDGDPQRCTGPGDPWADSGTSEPQKSPRPISTSNSCIVHCNTATKYWAILVIIIQVASQVAQW